MPVETKYKADTNKSFHKGDTAYMKHRLNTSRKTLLVAKLNCNFNTRGDRPSHSNQQYGRNSEQHVLHRQDCVMTVMDVPRPMRCCKLSVCLLQCADSLQLVFVHNKMIRKCAISSNHELTHLITVTFSKGDKSQYTCNN